MDTPGEFFVEQNFKIALGNLDLNFELDFELTYLKHLDFKYIDFN